VRNFKSHDGGIVTAFVQSMYVLSHRTENAISMISELYWEGGPTVASLAFLSMFRLVFLAARDRCL